MVLIGGVQIGESLARQVRMTSHSIVVSAMSGGGGGGGYVDFLDSWSKAPPRSSCSYFSASSDVNPFAAAAVVVFI